MKGRILAVCANTIGKLSGRKDANMVSLDPNVAQAMPIMLAGIARGKKSRLARLPGLFAAT